MERQRRRKTTARARATRATATPRKRQAAFWDYDIPEGWTPKTEDGWIWYLERKINADDLRGLKPAIVKRYLPRLRLDAGRRLLLTHYFRGRARHP